MDGTIEKSSIHAVSKLLKALANQKRLEILCQLIEGEKNVGELERKVALSQSALSQHLARLRADDIVATRRDAQTIYYSLKCAKTRALIKATCLLADEAESHPAGAAP